MKKCLRTLLSLLLVFSFLPFNLSVHITQAEEVTSTRPYIYSAEYADGSVTVDVFAEGNLAKFEIDVIYNSNEVEFDSVIWEEDAIYSEFNGVRNYVDMGTPRDYVALAGVCPVAGYVAQGTSVAKVVFHVKDGVKSTTIAVAADVEHVANYEEDKPLRDLGMDTDIRQIEITDSISPATGRGDVNGDGAISIEDALLTMKGALMHVAFSAQERSAADVDGDGAVSISDARLLLNQVAGLAPTWDGYSVAASDKIPAPTTTLTKNEDGTYTLDVSVTSADISMFDYGILLGDEWSVQEITWGSWKEGNGHEVVTDGSVMNRQGQKEYHFAGVCVDFDDNEISYTGSICKLTIKANVEDPFYLIVCPNSMNPERDRYIPVPNDGHYWPGSKPNKTQKFTPGIAYAGYSADGIITIDIEAEGNDDLFDIGLMYDSSKVECIGLGLDENFVDKYKSHAWITDTGQIDFRGVDQGSPRDYIVYSGGCYLKMNWNGVIAHATFRFKDGVDSAEFAVCKDSANYYDANEPLRNLAVKEDSVIVYKNGESKKTELITNPDGSVELRIETIRKENERLLKMVEKLLKLTEELYYYSVKKEQQLADGSTLVKEVSESAVEVNGRIEKSSVVKDERKDSTGKSMEAFEYDASVLDKNTEWKTDKKESVEDTYKDKVEAKKPRNSVMYDITPTVSGEAVQVSGGSVRVSLYYGEPKKEGSRFKVYDCEKDVWLNAHYEDGYIVFDATHFSKYVITEVDGVRQGDLDGDGNVTLGDAQLCLKAALKMSALDETQIPVADMDGDNQITLSDAQLCLKTALRII